MYESGEFQIAVILMHFVSFMPCFFFILKGGIQAPTGAPTYQAAPRDSSPVMVPQGYMGHLVMVPAENMQKMSHTPGTAQMYVPVPSQMPYQTTPSSSPLLIGDL